MCEVPLRVTASVQEDILQTRFEATRQLYNAWLGEALRRMYLLKQSQAYQVARKIPRRQKTPRQDAFAAARQAVGFFHRSRLVAIRDEDPCLVDWRSRRCGDRTNLNPTRF